MNNGDSQQIWSLFINVRENRMGNQEWTIQIHEQYLAQNTDSQNKSNNKITELRAILQRESQNSLLYKQTKSVNNRKTVNVMTLTWYRHF